MVRITPPQKQLLKVIVTAHKIGVPWLDKPALVQLTGKAGSRVMRTAGALVASGMLSERYRQEPNKAFRATPEGLRYYERSIKYTKRGPKPRALDKTAKG